MGTEFSIFDLMYKFRVWFQLEALYYGLYELGSKELGVYDWVRVWASPHEVMKKKEEDKETLN